MAGPGSDDPRITYRALKPDNFPFQAVVPARFSDVDVLHHINNVAVAGIIAEGRNAFVSSLFDRERRPNGLRFMVVQSAISYLDEANYPGSFVIATGVLATGTSSVRLAHGFFEGERCTSISETTLVATHHRRPAPLEPNIRRALDQLSIAPELFPSQLRGR